MREAPASATKGLGLDDDWSVIDRLALGSSGSVILINAQTDSTQTARIRRLAQKIFLAAATSADGETHLGEVAIAPDLYASLQSRRAGLEITPDDGHAVRLVPYSAALEVISPSRNQNPDPIPTEAGDRSAASGPPTEGAARLRALTSPKGFPDSLVEALRDRLAAVRAKADAALLFQAEYIDGHSEYLVAFWGAEPGDQDDLEAAVNQALASRKRPDVELGITFMDAEDPMAVRISRVGHRLTV